MIPPRLAGIVLLGLLLQLLPGQAHAARTWYSSSPNSTVTYTWPGTIPPVPAAQDSAGCVISIRNNDTRAQSFGIYTNLNNPGTGTQFQLFNGGNTSSTDRLNIGLTFRKGGQSSVLQNHSYSGNNTFSGAFPCQGVAIEMDVLQANLLSATGGITYSGTYNLCVGRGNPGNLSSRCQDGITSPPLPGNNTAENAYINFRVIVPKLLVVGGLIDMPMSYSTGSDASSSETFCIGRNTGDNIVVVGESSKTTSNGTFMMEGKTDSTKTLTYSVTVGSKTLTEKGPGTSYNTADGVRQNLDCSSGSGMVIVVTSQESEILAKTAQTYEDILTLRVSIE